MKTEPSILEMKSLLFEKINFERIGVKNSNELKMNISVKISHNEKNNIFKVTLGFEANKPEEYNIYIELAGFFTVITDDHALRQLLLNKNAVAILMPYIRSQLSLLTAQPETDCIVLPPFNVSKMIEDSNS